MKTRGSFKNELFNIINSIKSQIINRNLTRIIGRDITYLECHKALTKTVWGHKILLDTRDISLTPSILLNGFWEISITKVFMKTIKKGMIVVEIGSNMGYYTLIAASKIGGSGKLYAFEANPQLFKVLSQNVKINNFLDRVTLVNKAVFNESGNLKFLKLKHWMVASKIINFSEELLNQQRDGVEIIDVESISLDEYFADKSIKIDVIKMDAEGSEAHIFRGMKGIIKNNPQINIICGFHPQLMSLLGENPKTFLEEISSYGFKIRKIDANSGIIDSSMEELLAIPESELFLAR